MSRTRAEMIEATRVKLLAAGRKAFRESGYAAASMDELTAAAGLTRGALYHHFGDKQGLLAAVAAELDQEMDQRLQRISDAAPDAWTALRERCRAWLRMATEPEIQRIALQDARAVLGPTSETAQQPCIASLATMLQSLMDDGQVHAAEPQALARLINGALMDGAFWIAAAPDDGGRLEQALRALDLLLDGLRPR